MACVSGGTSGIGRAVTLALIKKGYFVLAIGKSQVHADELAALIAPEDAEHIEIIHGDLRNSDFSSSIAQLIESRHGKLDLLVNAAGSISNGGIKVESTEDWERVISTNLTAVFLLIQACLPLLQQGKNPNVVNISSICSTRPCTSLSYSVSKAGVDMLTKVLAKELAPDGIRVNAVNPGVVRSNLQISAGLYSSPEEYERWLQRVTPLHPLGRVGEPDDIAAAVLQLASEEASWITGTTLNVDGGRALI